MKMAFLTLLSCWIAMIQCFRERCDQSCQFKNCISLISIYSFGTLRNPFIKMLILVFNAHGQWYRL